MLMLRLQVDSLLGALTANSALTLQQADSIVTQAAAAAKADQGGLSGRDLRWRLMQAAVNAVAKHISPVEVQQQLRAAGLASEFAPPPPRVSTGQHQLNKGLAFVSRLACHAVMA